MATDPAARREFHRTPQPLSHTELWRRALQQLRSTFTSETYEQWFAKIRAVEMRSGKLVLAVDNYIARETLHANYYSPLSRAVEEVAGRRIQVEVVVRTDAGLDDAPDAIAATAPVEPDDDGEEPPPAVARTRPVLKRTFTLDNFVIGPSNQIAYAAAAAVAANPGHSHNPLFIYSASGLGKTHLLQAIAHATLETQPTQYIPAGKFVREFVEAVGANRRSAFQEKYEQIEVLILDDVQDFQNADGTQKEFFNLFNTLHLADKQIVLSSDTPPHRLHYLADRLVTRFEWGLVAEITPPDIELRLAILLQKCVERGVQADETVLRMIAHRASRNVRDLEGAFNYVCLLSETERSPISADLALRALERYSFEEVKRKPPTVGEIINAACEATGVPPEAFTTKRKDQRAARARHLAMYLAREHTGLSYKEIGVHFGDRDHTTVLHGYRKILTELEGNPDRGIPPKAETQRLISDIRAHLRV